MVLIRCGVQEEKLALVNGKLHLPTIEKVFQLQNIRLNGILYPCTDDGLTFGSFPDDDPINVTGDAGLS